MAITEESRFELHQRLRQVLGEGPGTTLMEHLPPADYATATDIDALSERMVSLDGRLSERVESLETRLSERITSLDTRLSERITSLDERLTQRLDTMATKADFKDLRSEMFRLVAGQTLAFVLANAAIISAVAAAFGGR